MTNISVRSLGRATDLPLTRRDLFRAGGLTALGLAAPAWTRGIASVPPPTREAMVPVKGGRVYVRVNGDLTGPRTPLVFVHGGPGGVHNSYVDMLSLADERAIILYDQLDSGRSDQPNDPVNWTVARFTDELEAIRAALGVRQWNVCGHSWGGTIALEYGARRPAALRGLVLASPLVSTRSWIADANALRGQLPADDQAAMSICDDPAAPAGACDAASIPFYRAFNGREPTTDARRAYRHTVGGRGQNGKLYNHMWGASEFVSTGTLKTYDGEPLLAKLSGPRTLFLVGQYDEARPVTTLDFAARVPGCEVAVVPGAAHGVFTDRPEESAAILRAWLARQDALTA